MSVYKYDEAIVRDLRHILQDNRIHIVPPENVFRLLARIDKDTIELPAVSISRRGWSLSGSRPHTMKFDGTLLVHVKDDDTNTDKYVNLQAIPMSIMYQMDVWTKTREENDNIMRELIFYYSTHPTLNVEIPYGSKDNVPYHHKFNIFFMEDIEDNSDIVNHMNRGEYFRQTISFYTDDAYLWKSTSRGPTVIDVDVLVKGEPRDENN